MSKNEKSRGSEVEIERLASAFLSLTDIDECMSFFGDLFTVKEMQELSSRLEVARLLKNGVNYVDIASKTGASTATISRVSKCLSGTRCGYRIVLSRIEENAQSADESCIKIDSLTEEEGAAIRAIVACLKAKQR